MTFLLSCSIRVAVILLLALVMRRILRSRSAAMRHWILSAGVFSSIAVPVFTLVVPRRNIDIVVSSTTASLPFIEDGGENASQNARELPAGPSRPLPTDSQSAKSNAPATATLPTPPKAAPPAAVNAEGSRAWPLERVLWTVWAMGSISVLVGLAIGAAQLFWIARKSRPLINERWTAIAGEASARYGLRRPVALLQSDRLPVLATWGARRPRLLVPADANEWPEERIRVAVFHEFAHIQRQDWFVQMAAELQRALYWFNPLAWILCKRLAQEREQASDDQALNSGIDAPEYANELLSLARRLYQPGRLWLAAAPMARPSTIERRFDAMLNPNLNRQHVGRLATLVTIVVCLVLTLPLTVLRLNAIAASAVAVLQSVNPLSSAQPDPVSPMPGARTSSIEGVILDSATGQPVAGVTVALPNPSENGVSVRSDSDGRFVISGIDPGTYRLTTNKRGYTPAHPEGRRKPSPGWSGGLFYTVSAGQPLENVVIRLSPGSAVTGRIVDAAADPIEGASVELVRKVYDREGKLNDYSYGESDTNDRGEYRIFDVDPGEYYLRVTGEMFISDPAVYYPGTEDFSRALPVLVKPGGELRLSDVVMKSSGVDTKKVPVHVRVINETGAAPGSVWSTHWGLKDTYGQGITSSMRRFGGPDKWELGDGLPPGLNEIALAWITPTGWALGHKTIQVGNEEMTVDLAIRMGVRVTVRALVEEPDGSTRPLPGLRLSFMGHPRAVQFNPSSTPRTITGDDGLLVLPNVPEISYDVSIRGLPADAYMIRARQGNRDLLRESAEVAGETLIEITVGSGGGTVEGAVTNSSGKRIAGAEVAIVPETSLRNMHYLYKTTNTDQQGKFALRGIAPGSYKVFALSEFNGDMPYLNSEFMKTIEDKGREIKIARGQRLSADVRLADEEQ